MKTSEESLSPEEALKAFTQAVLQLIPIAHYDDYLYPPTNRKYRIERNTATPHEPAPLYHINNITRKGETINTELLQHIGSSDDKAKR